MTGSYIPRSNPLLTDIIRPVYELEARGLAVLNHYYNAGVELLLRVCDIGQARRMQDCMNSGKITVLFNSNPIEFKQDTVVLNVNGQQQEIANDFVWIFAGDVLPTISLGR